MTPEPPAPSSRANVLQTSTLASLTRDVLTTTKRTLSASTVVTTMHTLATQATRARKQLGAWSTTATTRRLVEGVDTGATNASTTRVAHALSRWGTASWLYQWLTDEPDPDVIVIDLQDTYAIGPFITAIDHLVETLTPYYLTATLKRLTDTLTRLARDAADTRLGQLLVALFEPPEPPTDTADAPDDTDQEP